MSNIEPNRLTMLSQSGNASDIQCQASTYRYRPLQTADREIRVLILRQGKFCDEIRIALEHMPLPKERYPIRYRALRMSGVLKTVRIWPLSIGIDGLRGVSCYLHSDLALSDIYT